MRQDEAQIEGLKALLDWYRDVGADEAISETAIDWLAEGQQAPGAELRERLRQSTEPTAIPQQAQHSTIRGAPPAGRLAPAPQSRAPAPARDFPSQPPDKSQSQARDAASNAASLQELENALRDFDGCGLKATAKNLCLYRGAQQARIMFIGEAPGRDEDLQGKPFVGLAGQLLDKMLAAIGLDETNVHITNIVYWRPPGNRTPTPQEALVCRPFLERQIALVDPDFIIPLGGAAAKNLLNASEGIMRLRGKWRKQEFAGQERQVLATLHPAYLLRTPAAKRLAWRDLLTLKNALAS